MNKYKYLLHMVLAGILVSVASCVDDDLYYEEMTEGSTVVNLEAAFEPFAANSLCRATGGYEGKIMQDLSDLSVLVYDKTGNLYATSASDGATYPKAIDLNQFQPEDEDRDDANASNGHKAESQTKCVKNIPLNLPFGQYFIVAVANLGEYDEDGNILKSTQEVLESTYSEEIKTLDGLRKINVDWYSDNIMNNRAMLGYFDSPDASAPSHQSSFPLVNINKPGINIRAWLRRCASKVTVDIDGSGLRENIYVYVKDVRIYDISNKCTLGFGEENVTSDDDYKNFNFSAKSDDDIIKDVSAEMPGNVITFCDNPDADPSTWPEISKGKPYITNQSKAKIDFHSETADALYFYENMQGDAPHGKIPEADLSGGHGGVIDKNDKTDDFYDGKIANFKDGIKYGTYIEVTAYYVANTNDQAMTEGHEIKYRFMLGKDVDKNCDVERNIHYKLTLCLRGNAKDYDWHIEYKENEGFDVPNPWYVSYLYNHKSILPFKYTPPEGWEVTEMKAEILVNPWYPYKEQTDPNDKDDKEYEDNKYIAVPDGENATIYTELVANKYTGNGFLSLRYSDKVVITDMEARGSGWKYGEGEGTDYGDESLNAHYINQAYYEGKAPSSSKIDRSKRTYQFGSNASDDTNTGEEAYSYLKEGDKYTFQIPLFTRAKVMVKATAYSGNNPFVGYPRRAKLKLTATIRNKSNHSQTNTQTEIVNVIQVRRIVNPKGVYRKAGNNEDFHVRLLRLPGDDATSFVDFDSRGPWMAEIIGDKNFISLNGRDRITGSTGSKVDFTIKFNKTNSNPNDKTVRNAVVRVLYHNYTCTHLIFVRQGYEPQDIGTGTAWRSFNLIADNLDADDPRDEGSMFKYGNVADPIDTKNNAYGDAYGDGDGNYGFPSKFGAPDDYFMTDKNGNIAAAKKKWLEFGKNADGFTDAKIAEATDFYNLYLTDHIQFGYGVLYADGATDTQYDLNKAYGFYRRNGDMTRGMRGLFAYYWDIKNLGAANTAKNIFFPIGRAGYGHRKNKWEKTEDLGKGIMR